VCSGSVAYVPNLEADTRVWNVWQNFRVVFPKLFDLAVPLTSLFISHGTPWGKHLFFKLIYFIIISYVRDEVVYCCWIYIYALINDVILFIYYFYLSRYP
jgi:hypothetical protein